MNVRDDRGRVVLGEKYYLTDGGLETTLIFHRGMSLPHFATFDLLVSPEGKGILREYLTPYLATAAQYGLGFVMETPTWRSSTDWGYRLGYSEEELRTINMEAIRFAREVAGESDIPLEDVIVSGCIGPRGDGYSVAGRMTAEEAEAYHAPQIGAFAQAGADVVTAMTINYIDEGIGIVNAAKAEGVPVIISFTLETDGRLPSGESLGEAIEQTDRQTDGYASYFMINCAHPEHFLHQLEGEGEWKSRIRGIRANASTKSHAELDESETLDVGDRTRLADGYVQLRSLLPELRVVGGCCGTDHTHIGAVCEHMFAAATDGVR